MYFDLKLLNICSVSTNDSSQKANHNYIKTTKSKLEYNFKLSKSMPETCILVPRPLKVQALCSLFTK